MRPLNRQSAPHSDVEGADFSLSQKCFSGNCPIAPRKLRNIAGRAGFHLTLAIACTE
jgi:hypothetical protein